MKRFIVLIIIAYILGIIIGLYKLSCVVLFFVFFITIGYIYLSKINFAIKLRNKFKSKFKNIMVLFLAFILGVLYIRFYSENWEKINNNLNENNLKLEIINLEKETNYQKTFKAKILNGKNKNKNVLLKVNNKQNLFKKIEIGHKIYANCQIQEIEVQRNTGGFDYKEYLKSKNIYGIMKFKSGKIIENNKYSIYYIKNAIIKNIYLKLKKEDADFILALTIGYKASLDQEIKENFSKINLSHMLAISGMHISYLMIVLNFIFKSIKSKYKSLILIFILFFFNSLIGDIPSVNRVCITFILSLVSSFFYRKSDNLCNLAVSGMIILLKNPYSVKDLSFIFSYIGTIGIILIYPILKEKFEVFLVTKKILLFFQSKNNKFLSIFLNKVLNYLLEMVLITISANMLLVPLIVYNFNSIFLLFILSNAIISPIFTICIIFSFILLLISYLPLNLFEIFSNIYSIIIEKIIWLTNFFSNLEFFNILISTPKVYILLITYLLILAFIFFQRSKKIKFKIFEYIKENLMKKIKQFSKIKSITAVILIFILIFTIYNISDKKTLKIYFVDVGQGDCCLIVTPNNKKVLIDGGGEKSDSYDIGKNVLIPYLLDRGIKKIDYIIISHFDTDHVRRITFCNERIKGRLCNN